MKRKPLIIALIVSIIAASFAFLPEKAEATTTNYYAQAGTGHSDYISNSAAWNTMVNAASAPSGVSTANGEVRCDYNTGNSYRYLVRGHLTFDTSAIPDDATITEIKVYTKGNGTISHNADWTLHVVTSTQASATALGAADYGRVGKNSGGGVLASTLSDSDWSSITLNATTTDWISKTGSTLIAFRCDRDLNNVDPNGFAYGNYYQYYSSGGDAPYLAITYTEAGGGAEAPIGYTQRAYIID
jgi:hypothetical protein